MATGEALNGERTASPRYARDPVLAAVVALAVAAAVSYMTAPGGGIVGVAACWLLLAVGHTVLLWCAKRVADMPGLAPPVRRFWRAVAFTGFTFLVSDAVQAVTIYRDPASVAAALGGVPQTACMFVGSVMLLGVMLGLPLGIRTGPERRRFYLDVATVMVAAATFGAYTTTVVVTRSGTGSWALDLAQQLVLGPAVYLVGAFTVAKLLLGGQAPFTRAAGLLGGAAAGLQGITQGMNGPLIDSGRLSWVLGLTVVANAVLAASARVQQLQIRHAPGRWDRRRARPYSFLPYVAVGSTYLLLIVVLAHAPERLDLRVWFVVCGAIGSSGLVVARQLAAFADNSRLLDELALSLRERDELAAQLHHLAYHDSLTGLDNRALFLQRLEVANGPHGSRNTQLAVVLVDLDDFKPVNDTYGHSAGDRVLQETANRLRSCVADADSVARLGGDEFALFVECTTQHSVQALAERMVDLLRTPVQVSAAQTGVGASIGIAVCRPGELVTAELLHQADLAMYAAKGRGKGTYDIRRPVRPDFRRPVVIPAGVAEVGVDRRDAPHDRQPLPTGAS